MIGSSKALSLKCQYIDNTQCKKIPYFFEKPVKSEHKYIELNQQPVEGSPPPAPTPYPPTICTLHGFSLTRGAHPLCTIPFCSAQICIAGSREVGAPLRDGWPLAPV